MANRTLWCEINDGVVYYHHTDHLGTTEVITDSNGERPYSAGCQIPHLEDFNEVTGILKDLGFEYGKGNDAWTKGDTIKINIKSPEKE